jgi:hypothetical protein
MKATSERSTTMSQATTTTPRRVFRDRREAGHVLGRLLQVYRGKRGVVVLGLPRGGIPVAWEVTAALDERNAYIVRNAEVYYRAMFSGTSQLLESSRHSRAQDRAAGAAQQCRGTDARDRQEGVLRRDA